MTRTDDIDSKELVATMPASEVPAAANNADPYTKLVIEMVDVLVLRLDLAGKIMTCNPAVERHTGFVPSEIVGRSIENTIFPSDEVKHFQDILDMLRAGERLVEWEGDVLTNEGQYRRIRWACSPVAGQHEAPRCFVAVGTDITDQWNRPGEDEQSEERKERRRQPRRPFRYYQPIAPLVDGQKMEQHTFFEVHCYDISAGGFSFTSKIVPQHREFVVAFGTPPKLTYIAAEVVRISPIEIDGEKTNLIGCRYTDRVNH